MIPLRIAAIGSVSNHDIKIPETTRRFASLVINPMPKSEPTETCVVETGNPNLLAKITSADVTRLAVNPCPGLSGVIFLLIVIATLRAFISPPIAIAIATVSMPSFTSKVLIMSSNATIFGVSFKPRANPTLPALKKMHRIESALNAAAEESALVLLPALFYRSNT